MSISSRLLIAASLMLSVCLGMIGLTLDQSYREAAAKALNDRVQSQLYSIIASVDLGLNGRMFMPQDLPEERFAKPDSGLYAQIRSHDGSQFWQSLSTGGIKVPYAENLARGDVVQQIVRASNNEELYTISMGLAWEVSGRMEAFTFSAAENMFDYNRELQSYTNSLWTWLAGVGVGFLFIQAIVLRWGLSPLRRVVDDLTAIEQGKKSQLEGGYPKEIDGLTTHLNSFIRSEREHINRYRNSLSDLAHSLKTPLAVLQNEISTPGIPASQKAVLGEQVERMRQLVEYQLQKAASSGRTTLAAPVSVDSLIQRIVASLEKVYKDKKINVHMTIDPDAVFGGDKGDFLEIMGNVADNAYKWAKSTIRIEARLDKSENGKTKKVVIVVEDDGPGIPEDKARDVLQRGVRADEQVQGHGIGLAVVRDLVQLYNGKLEIGRAKLGGARIKLTLYS